MSEEIKVDDLVRYQNEETRVSDVSIGFALVRIGGRSMRVHVNALEVVPEVRIKADELAELERALAAKDAEIAKLTAQLAQTQKSVTTVQDICDEYARAKNDALVENARLRNALTPFALATEDEDIRKAGYDRPICISTWSRGLEQWTNSPISYPGTDEDEGEASPVLKVSHLRAAAEALKDAAK